jgi:DNA-binding response OmpR family regulator
MASMAPEVLIVDDDLDLREALGEMFAHLGGVPCVLAGSLGDLEHDRVPGSTNDCHLAIVDINLGPGQPTGVEVVRWLRSHAFRGKIVFLTGHGLGDPRVMAAAELADTEILSKPIGSEVLSRLIDHLRGAD